MREGFLRDVLLIFAFALRACALAIFAVAVHDTPTSGRGFASFASLMALCIAATAVHWFAKDIEGIVK